MRVLKTKQGSPKSSMTERMRIKLRKKGDESSRISERD
jgi:hypothetical protein